LPPVRDSSVTEYSNSSAQDFAFTAKSVKTRKLSQGNLPLAEGDLEYMNGYRKSVAYFEKKWYDKKKMEEEHI